MNFDAKSLLTAPLPPEATVDAMRAHLDQLAAMGFGSAKLTLPTGVAIRKLELVAHGELPAHFVLSDGLPPATFQTKVK